MTDGPRKIAIDNLKKLKEDLRGELGNLESNIAELEADIVVKRSRVQELSDALQNVPAKDFMQALDSDFDNQPAGSPEVTTTKTQLKNIIDEVGKAVSEPIQSQLLGDTYNSYRSRLITTINALDLIGVALRKTETIEKKFEEEVAKISPEHAVGSRAAPGSSAIIRSQELERHRIAREIHDGPAQAVANVVLRMDILAKIYEKDPTQVPDELKRMKQIAQNALDEIRGFIFDLRPMSLADLGLIATIKRIVSNIQEMSKLDVRLVIDGDERNLGQLVTLTVFRIAQESLNNLRKYSKCTSAWVHLKYLPDRVILIVEDDGLGFDLQALEDNRNNYTSFGLLGMRERADDINAEFGIVSAPNEGTKITLVVPTKDNPALEVKWEN